MVRASRRKSIASMLIRWTAALLVVAAVGCSGNSPTRELEHDASRDTIAGPRPTAPPSTELGGPGLSSEAVELLNELREFRNDNDLCDILSSNTVKSLLGGKLEVSGLVTTPSGIAQVLVELDLFFDHLVKVSPAAVRPSMATIQKAWKDLSAIEADALDKDQRSEAVISDPAVQQAVKNVGTWTQQNCLGQSTAEFDLSELLGGLS